jgi:hypothetical protein
MIAYDLQCTNGHTFEGWFKDSKAYLKQQKAGLITCPVCNDGNVHRIPSTFAIKGTPSLPPNDGPSMDRTALSRAIMQYVEKNFDNVGTDFAKEALKMHYGVSEPRNIRGVSTAQEEETLRQEGIDFIKVPMPSQESTPSSNTPSSSDPEG